MELFPISFINLALRRANKMKTFKKIAVLTFVTSFAIGCVSQPKKETKKLNFDFNFDYIGSDCYKSSPRCKGDPKFLCDNNRKKFAISECTFDKKFELYFCRWEGITVRSCE